MRFEALSILGLLVAGIAALACSSGGGGGGGGGGGTGCATPAALPAQADWTHAGLTGVRSAGAVDQWNTRINGAISPFAVVKRGNTFFLYFMGADGDRSDGGPRHRAMGVATSTNGIDYTMHPGNPVLTHLTQPTSPNNDEEGIFSGAVALDAGGTFILYYGGLTATSPGSGSVFGDGLRATSSDGINFTPNASPGVVVLDHTDSGIWNSGDELYPIGVFRDGGTYYLYYTGQGNVDNWALGLATGSSASFPLTQGLIGPVGSADEIIGGGSIVPDADGFLLFLLRNFNNRTIEVYDVPANNPSDIGSSIQSYQFPSLQHFAVTADADAGRWLMYVAETSRVRVYTAPLVCS